MDDGQNLPSPGWEKLLNGVEERGSKGQLKGTSSSDGHQTRLWLHGNGGMPHYPMWSHILTGLPPVPFLPLAQVLSCKSSKNRRRQSVLYGPITHLFRSAPLMEIAAHMVMEAPLWPGTVTVALLPIMFSSTLTPFRQVEASLVNVDHFMRDLIGLQLHDSLKVIRHSMCKCFTVCPYCTPGL